MESDNLDNAVNGKIWLVLKEDMELRFDVEMNSAPVYLELESGTAELFGKNLVTMRHYKILPNSKVAVFTWDGCKLNIYGKVVNVYTSENTPMFMYFNLHAGLNEMREKAKSENARGPRVLVAGPSGVGKSTLCKILVNYALRAGWCTMFVDLDVSQNDISIPGTIAAMLLSQPADIEEGFMSKGHLTYHFGHTSPESNIKLYDMVVQKLADTINIKCDISDDCNNSGVVINTCGWTQKEGYQCLLNTINAFEAEVVVVLEHELLFQNLNKDVPDYVKVLHFPRPGGVFEVSHKKDEERSLAIRNYFYGIKSDLCPHIIDVRFGDIQIFKVTAFKDRDILLPLKMQDISVKLAAVPITSALQYHVLSASHALSKDDDVIQTNISGFVIVNKVDMERQVLTLLSPKPRPFQWNILFLIEGLTYQES